MPPSTISSISSIEAVKAGLKIETSRPLLSEYVDAIVAMPIGDSVTAMSDLVHQLNSYISYSGKRCVKHPKYKGLVDLRHVARIWMKQGGRCRDENATFSIRLKQYSLLPRFKRLYVESKQDVKRSKVVWVFTPFRDFRLECPCCSGDPLFCIPHGERCGDALEIQRDVYEKYWPGQKKAFWNRSYRPDGQQIEVTHVKVEELEDMIARDSQQKVES